MAKAPGNERSDHTPQLHTAFFTAHLRDFADHIDSGEFHLAYLRAMDAWAVGNQLKDEVEAVNAKYTLNNWEGKDPQALVDAFGEFLTGVSTACEAEASRKRGRDAGRH